MLWIRSGLRCQGWSPLLICFRYMEYRRLLLPLSPCHPPYYYSGPDWSVSLGSGEGLKARQIYLSPTHPQLLSKSRVALLTLLFLCPIFWLCAKPALNIVHNTSSRWVKIGGSNCYGKMQKSSLTKILLTRENLYRLGLALFGFSFFPGIVFLISNILFKSHTTMPAFYSKFYRSLLTLGLDGLYSWAIVCAPYIAYDIYLLIKSYRIHRIGENDDI